MSSAHLAPYFAALERERSELHDLADAYTRSIGRVRAGEGGIR